MIFNPPSVAASQQEESQHKTSGLSSLLGTIPSVLQYQQIDTPQPFLPSQLQPAPSPVPYQPVQPAESAQISGLACTSRIKTSPSKGHQNLPKTINNLNVYAQKQKSTLSNT